MVQTSHAQYRSSHVDFARNFLNPFKVNFKSIRFQFLEILNIHYRDRVGKKLVIHEADYDVIEIIVHW